MRERWVSDGFSLCQQPPGSFLQLFSAYVCFSSPYIELFVRFNNIPVGIPRYPHGTHFADHCTAFSFFISERAISWHLPFIKFTWHSTQSFTFQQLPNCISSYVNQCHWFCINVYSVYFVYYCVLFICILLYLKCPMDEGLWTKWCKPLTNISKINISFYTTHLHGFFEDMFLLFRWDELLDIHAISHGMGNRWVPTHTYDTVR